MTNCCGEGQLRAYLDGELLAIERASIGAHIASCAACRAALEAQRAAAAQARALLPAPATIPDPSAALARLRAAQGLAEPDGAQPTSRRLTMPTFSSLRTVPRSWLAGLAAVVAIAGLLALPPVRAAADQLLSVFRVQKVVFMPIDPARVQQLQSLKLDGGGLFIGKPQSSSAPPQSAASAGEAAQAAGYTIAEPMQFPSAPLNAEYTIMGARHEQVQVNVAAARQVLDLLDIHDVSIPDALGTKPIQVATEPFVAARYHGANYDMTLNQGRSPSVTVPDGVSLADLGKVALRVLGTPPEQAEIASRQINWSNTLIFPFPADADNIREVTVNGEPALLVGGGGRGDLHWQLYWQSGEQLYMLSATGDSSLRGEDLIAALISTAESVR